MKDEKADVRELYTMFFVHLFDEKHGIALVEDLLKLHKPL